MLLNYNYVEILFVVFITRLSLQRYKLKRIRNVHLDYNQSNLNLFLFSTW